MDSLMLLHRVFVPKRFIANWAIELLLTVVLFVFLQIV